MGGFNKGPCQGGEFALCLTGFGKIELFQMIFFLSQVPNSYKHLFGEDERV